MLRKMKNLEYGPAQMPLLRCVWWLIAAVLCGCGQPEEASRLATDAMTMTDARTPRTAAQVFISGHSLVDRPFPDYFEQVASSMATPMQWERQYLLGSTIELRTRGSDASTTGWPGYRQGHDREGKVLDVLAELQQPRELPGKYDVLLITEQHHLLDALRMANTVRYLRHYHDRFIEANAAGATYFYEPWIGIDDKSDPTRWIAYERAASPIWQCVATRVNQSLAAEGRADRIESVPVAAALAQLVERITDMRNPTPLSRATVEDTMNFLVADDVHLREPGVYYVALVTYAFIFNRLPEDVWSPSDFLQPEEAKFLQTVAGEFVRDYWQDNRPLTLEECRSYLAKEGFAYLWGYMRDAQWRHDVGTAHAYLRWLRRILGAQYEFSRKDHRNPFHFDPSTDADDWYPAP